MISALYHMTYMVCMADYVCYCLWDITT